MRQTVFVQVHRRFREAVTSLSPAAPVICFLCTGVLVLILAVLLVGGFSGGLRTWLMDSAAERVVGETNQADTLCS